MCHIEVSKPDPATCTIPIKFILEDPQSLTGGDKAEHTIMAAKGQDILDVALGNGINIEHSCGGVCACSTCHVYVEKGLDLCSEPAEAEEDRVEEAPGLQRNSRLSCQCIILKESREGLVVRVPAWNRNAVKEVPH